VKDERRKKIFCKGIPVRDRKLRGAMQKKGRETLGYCRKKHRIGQKGDFEIGGGE